MLAITLYVGILFVLLTPGILLRIPKDGSKWTVAIVHALVFSLIYYYSQSFYGKEGFFYAMQKPDIQQRRVQFTKFSPYNWVGTTKSDGLKMADANMFSMPRYTVYTTPIFVN